MSPALPRDLSCPRIATRKGGLELSRIVADHHGLTQEPMRIHRPPQRTFGGNAHWIGRHLQTGDAEL